MKKGYQGNELWSAISPLTGKREIIDPESELIPSETIVKLVGEAQPPSADSDILPVSVNSPMGEALMKARIGETIRVKAPRGTMEFKILEIM